jgi:hypothetical protein
MAKAREKGLQRGIPIAIFDGLSFGVAGKLAKRVSTLTRGGVPGAIAGAAAKTSAQAALGAGGEAAGQIVSEGEVSNWGDVGLEGSLEMPGAAIEVPAAVLATRAATNPPSSTGAANAVEVPAGFAPLDEGAIAEGSIPTVGPDAGQSPPQGPADPGAVPVVGEGIPTPPAGSFEGTPPVAPIEPELFLSKKSRNPPRYLNLHLARL